MTARDNIAFGLRARGRHRADARAEADRILADMQLAHRADARPAELSGGQAQRVALARSLAVAPRLLLLDEPFAALDPPARAELRGDVRRHAALSTGGTVLVTHDPLDALVLADQVVVMEAGRVVQAGAPAELARRPRTEYVARLAGLNLLRGTAHGTTAVVGGTHVAIAEAHYGDVLLAIRPTSIAVHLQAPEGSPRNAWPAVLTSVEVHGDQVRLATSGPLDLLVDVTPDAAAQLRLAPGTAVWLAVKATEVTAYPA
jgi:molybdate transport system ATP-binding protein